MRFVIFDLEATCWDGNAVGRQQEIIEFGAILTDVYGDRESTFQKFVRPILNPSLSMYCQNLTGIRQEDVSTAKTFAHVVQQFIDWAELDMSDYVLCSWGNKDLEFLKSDCSLHRSNSDWLEPYIDLKEQYHQIRGIQRKRGLKKTLVMEGFEFEGAHHRALDDASNLFELFKKYRDMWMY